MTNSIKKQLLSLLKSLGYGALSLIHGKIKGVVDYKKHPAIKVLTINFDNDINYRIFKIKKCRIYTDTVTDTAFISEDKIVEGPSFQHRNPKNAGITENIVFQKGTPKLKKKLNGSVLSLLTGGAGNNNYWHWLFDVLPRIKIFESSENLELIDFFLFRDITQKYQIESLDFLKIPYKKRLSSKVYRHIQADTVIAVDHPYVLANDPSNEIQNLPNWILEYLRKSF